MTVGLIYAGRVVDTTVGGPLVVVPQIGGTASFGPLPSAVPDLAVGEVVLITSLGASRDQLVVLGRMAGRVPDVGEIPGLATRLTGIDTLNAAQNGRLGTIESKNTEQDGRLNGVESVNATQETAISTNTTAISTNTTAVAAVWEDTVGKVTTKGDLLVATAAGVVARRGVGATDQALLADPVQIDGVAWKTVKGIPVGLTGAVEATRYVGATTAGAPVTGTFAVGDLVVDRGTGDTWVCTIAGSPGTWVSRTKTAADRLTALEGYEKYGWTGDTSVAHDTAPLITAWPTAASGNSTRIASPNTTGIVTLGRAGRWSLGFFAYSNAFYNGYTRIQMNWPNGAWLPVGDLADGRWRGSGFSGAGQSWQQTSWTGWVTAAQAAQPIRFYAHQINPNAETVNYSFGLTMNYMGGA